MCRNKTFVKFLHFIPFLDTEKKPVLSPLYYTSGLKDIKIVPTDMLTWPTLFIQIHANDLYREIDLLHVLLHCVTQSSVNIWWLDHTYATRRQVVRWPPSYQ